MQSFGWLFLAGGRGELIQLSRYAKACGGNTWKAGMMLLRYTKKNQTNIYYNTLVDKNSPVPLGQCCSVWEVFLFT